MEEQIHGSCQPLDFVAIQGKAFRTYLQPAHSGVEAAEISGGCWHAAGYSLGLLLTPSDLRLSTYLKYLSVDVLFIWDLRQLFWLPLCLNMFVPLKTAFRCC